MRENRTYGSEGGEGESPSRPLSSTPASVFVGATQVAIWAME